MFFFLVLILSANCFAIEKVNNDKNLESWTGKWFPWSATTLRPLPISDPDSSNRTDVDDDDNWTGKWFPFSPKEPTNRKTATAMESCDNENESADLDFNWDDPIDSYNYLCLDKKKKYEPNEQLKPIQRDHIIPPAYKAPVICTNENITYDVAGEIPTFGPYRQNMPLFGDYKFLPIQRWMHTLKVGGVVALYHPCANKMQVKKLKDLIQSCLYRHVITPSKLLSADKPLAVLSWGRSLEMSVFEPRFIKNFIRDSGRNSMINTEVPYSWYDKGLIKESKLITTQSDDMLCPYIE